MNIAVIFAGGVGKRMNSNAVPKQFLKLHGKEIIIYTIEQFEAVSEIDAIVIVSLESWIPYLEDAIKKYPINKVKAIVPGGETGQGSIYNGLKEAHSLTNEGDSIVLIHDGVRPLIDAETIKNNLLCARKHRSAITIAPAIETIIRTSPDHSIQEIIDRSCCQLARAPQSFYLRDVWAAHMKARAEKKLDFIDTACLMSHYGYPLHTVEGPAENIKITTPNDFYMFQAIYDSRKYF